VSDAPAAAGRRAAASYLRELLQRPGAYRRMWEQHVIRARSGEITQLAVAEVLARRLWQLWEGTGTISVLSGPRAVTPRTEQELQAAIGPRRHQTLSLHDHATVGPDGKMARTRTLQVIEAISDKVDRIPFLYDTKALTLEVGQGCTELTGDLYQVSEDLFVTYISLAQPLDAGETTTLEYWMTYQYPGDPLDPHERQYRRAVMRRLENFDIRVEFHPDKLPAGVWWATWDGVDGGIIEQEPVTLDTQHSVHRYLRFIEKTVAGFHWSW